MLYLEFETDDEEDNGVKVRVTTDPSTGQNSIKIDLTHWGEGVEEFAHAICVPSAAEGLSALIAAVAQNAFNAGVVHGKEDLVGIGMNTLKMA